MPIVQINNHISLFYESQCNGDTIVFAHEFGGDYRSWYKQIDYFKADFHCITYSARGFHPSSIPKQQSDYGQKQATLDLLALFNALNLESAHLVGTSMGSFTSLDFALNYTDRVKTLTLVGNSSGPRTSQERQSYRDGWVAPEIERRRSEGAEGSISILEADPAYQNCQRTDKHSWDYYAQCLRAQCDLSFKINLLGLTYPRQSRVATFVNGITINGKPRLDLTRIRKPECNLL